jgi:integrase
VGVTVRQGPKDRNRSVHVTHRNRRKARKVGPSKEGGKSAKKVGVVTRGRLTLDTFDWWGHESKAILRPGMTLEAYTKRWLASPAVVRLKVGTREKYEEATRLHWLPDLGQIPLTALTKDHVKVVLADKTHYSKSLLPMAVSVLPTCLNAAIEEKLIAENPAVRLGMSLVVTKKRPISIFTPSEIARLLTTCRVEFPHLYPTTLILARTGMRLGEVLALQVGDIDFAQHRTWVRRIWGSRKAKVGELRINTPKNGKERGVDVSNQRAPVLKRHVRYCEARPNAWLFPSTQARLPWLPDTLRYRWELLVKAAGVPYRHPHTRKHTYASLLIRNGESLACGVRRLGHRSITIAVDTYGHLVPSLDRTAVDRLDEICK